MTDDQENFSAASPLSSNLNELRDHLRWMIDVDYTLLSALRNMFVLNKDQIELIRSKPTKQGEVDQLLDFITRLSYQQQKQFLIALFESKQTHVNNYIISNGRRPSAGEQNWPLYGTDDYSRIDLKWAELIELTDSVNGLLDEMVAAGCISAHHKQRIEAQNASLTKMRFYYR
jgi:hypothetical protein